jgi:diadenosine tetraphosphatase ApaH/serine/threonine PP2A family protein phosphatase
MRRAILTDIHGNREAFEAVLADLSARAIDRIVILGDIVGYGPDPEWCVARAQALAAAGAVVVQGNHDAAVAGAGLAMKGPAQAVVDWTRARLPAPMRAWLGGLPLVAETDGLCLVHASASDPAGWVYITSEVQAAGCFRATAARLVFCGHVHVPRLLTCDARGHVRDHAPLVFGTAIPLLTSRRWLAVVGAVGQPRDGVPQASYAIHDAAAGTLTFRRRPYDTAATAAKLRAAGLPEVLARRLLTGV